MTRFDNFMDSLSGSLVVAVFIAVVFVTFYLAQYLPLGILFPVLIFFAGAAIGVIIALYASGFFSVERNTN